MAPATLRYSLDVDRCPFGWPVTPSYPIDLPSPEAAFSSSAGGGHASTEDDVMMTDGTTDVSSLQDGLGLTSEQEDDKVIRYGGEGLEDEVRSRYYDALFSDANAKVKPPLLPLARRLRSYNSSLPRPTLLKTYERFVLPEDLLARKWRTVVPGHVDGWLKGEDVAPAEGEEAFALDATERKRMEEAVRKRKREVDNSNITRREEQDEEAATEGKPIFVKAVPTKDWIEGWAAREAQLQILLVLELLVLRPSADSAPVISTPHPTRAASSSPRKQARPKLQRKGVSFATDDGQAPPLHGLDLDKLLEGLVDRLAMWQAISGLGDALGDLFGEGKGKKKDDEEAKEAEMDEVQRFWTDVVEEYYADALPSLTPSLRPKLFPTSFLSSDLSSSIIPTPFRSARKASRTNNPTKTPNLKSLERRAVEKAKKEDAARLKKTMSPTMAKLVSHGSSGLDDRAARFKRPRPTKTVSASASTGLGPVQAAGNGIQKAVSSRSLFSRREVNMSRKPSKAKLDLGPPVEEQPKAPVGVWGQQNLRMPAPVRPAAQGMSDATARRKQMSPRKKAPGSTTVVFATPRLDRISVARVLATEEDEEEDLRLGKGGMLVPDTPASAGRTVARMLAPDTPAS